jgi:predicted enzyme related to lactoylglutathione lyase
MPRIVHFEIHCDDPERAAEFYRRAFDWEISKWEGPVEYWLVKTGSESEPGIDGGLARRRDASGSIYNTIQVPAIDEYIERVISGGGTIVVPKSPVPGVGWLAYFKDTENNMMGIMQLDPGAR